MSGAKVTPRKTGHGEGSAELVRLCHDLRQYVSAGLLLSTMPTEDAPDADLRSRIDLLHQHLLHMSELISTVSRGLPPRAWPLDLGALAEECVETVKVTGRVAVRVEDRGGAVGYGDPVLVRRALLNVLDNAARAGGPDTTVVVIVGTDKNMAWVEVVDEGAGFGHIAFGTGHGLQVVQDALSASRGRLEISSGPGEGTRVRMMFPVRVRGERAS